jgi:hypothetical protein
MVEEIQSNFKAPFNNSPRESVENQEIHQVKILGSPADILTPSCPKFKTDDSMPKPSCPAWYWNMVSKKQNRGDEMLKSFKINWFTWKELYTRIDKHNIKVTVCRCQVTNKQTKKQTPWPGSASELYQPSDRRLLAKLVPTFADRRCHVISVTDPYDRILGFLDRSRYNFFQAALQLYSRGWVGPVTDPLLLRKSGSAGNRIRTSGSVAKNSDH